MSAPALTDSPVSCADAHWVVDQLVAEGLPRPLRASARESDGEVSLSLTLADPDEFQRWTAHLDSTGAVPDGPWWFPPRMYRIAVGRLIDVPAVLMYAVDPPLDEPEPSNPAPPATPAAATDDAPTAEYRLDRAAREGLAVAARIARRLHRAQQETA